MGMLVLTRKWDEGIWVGEFGRVIVVKLFPDAVRLGFEFPAGVSVLREELFNKIRDNERLNRAPQPRDQVISNGGLKG